MKPTDKEFAEAIRVVSGNPTEEELAAVIAVIQQAAKQQSHLLTEPESSWSKNSSLLRAPITPGHRQ